MSSEGTGVWLDFRFDVLVAAGLGAAFGAGFGAGFDTGFDTGLDADFGGSSWTSFFLAGRPLLGTGFGFGAGVGSSSGMGSGCTVFALFVPRVK